MIAAVQRTRVRLQACRLFVLADIQAAGFPSRGERARYDRLKVGDVTGADRVDHDLNSPESEHRKVVH